MTDSKLNEAIRTIVREEADAHLEQIRKDISGVTVLVRLHANRLAVLEGIRRDAKSDGWVNTYFDWCNAAAVEIVIDRFPNLVEAAKMEKLDLLLSKSPFYRKCIDESAAIIRKHAPPAAPVVVLAEDIRAAVRESGYTLQWLDGAGQVAAALTKRLQERAKETR